MVPGRLRHLIVAANMAGMAMADDRESDRMRRFYEDDEFGLPPATVHGVNRPDHVTSEEPITLEEFRVLREAGVV